MIAAEIWGISIDQVMARIADGSIHSRVEGQFVFVWVNAGDEAAMPPPAIGSPNPLPAPASCEIPVLTLQERNALEEEFAIPEDSEPMPDVFSMVGASTTQQIAAEELAAEPMDDESASPDPHDSDGANPGKDVSQWRIGRQQAARLRRPPPARLAG
jgi:hypothetical protein